MWRVGQGKDGTIRLELTWDNKPQKRKRQRTKKAREPEVQQDAMTPAPKTPQQTPQKEVKQTERHIPVTPKLPSTGSYIEGEAEMDTSTFSPTVLPQRLPTRTPPSSPPKKKRSLPRTPTPEKPPTKKTSPPQKPRKRLVTSTPAHNSPKKTDQPEEYHHLTTIENLKAAFEYGKIFKDRKLTIWQMRSKNRNAPSPSELYLVKSEDSDHVTAYTPPRLRHHMEDHYQSIEKMSGKFNSRTAKESIKETGRGRLIELVEKSKIYVRSREQHVTAKADVT